MLSAMQEITLISEDFSKTSDELIKELNKYKIDAPKEDIELRLRKLIVDFRVPEADAIKSVRNYYLKEAGISDRKRMAGSSRRLSIVEK